jgi:hypothetical protein
MLERFIRFITLTLCCVSFGFTSEQPEDGPGLGDSCPIMVPAWSGTEVVSIDPGAGFVCHLMMGSDGWREEEEKSDSSFPKYSLDVRVVRSRFVDTAKIGGFMFRPPGSRPPFRVWPEPEETAVPPIDLHPNPEAAPYWCTPDRNRGETCGAEFVTGDEWSGFLIEAQFGFHSSSGYGGSVEVCRAIIEGPHGVCLAIEGIGGCHDTRRFLNELRFKSDPSIRRR